jgi:hypothetical protein
MNPLFRGWVVVLYRADDDYSQILIGPFRTRERAEERKAVIEKLAAQYEDPEGSVGGDNVLGVEIEPLVIGRVSAADALSALYGSVSVEP